MVSGARSVWLVVTVVTCLLFPHPVATGQGGGNAVAVSLAVTVTYSGKGQVDGSHLLWIWLWNSPDFAKDTPFDGRTLEMNGGTAHFEGLEPTKVWITVVYDKEGTYDGHGPPASSAPAAV